MKRRVHFTEQARRFRDYIPADDRKTLLHVVDQIANDPLGPDTHLAYRDE
jgi:mRNA-degrading endonuclease RelE of RelBE toxin-antitoxin system